MLKADVAVVRCSSSSAQPREISSGFALFDSAMFDESSKDVGGNAEGLADHSTTAPLNSI